MNKAALLKLAKFLDTVPEKHFNLDTFCSPNGFDTKKWCGIASQGSDFIERFKYILSLNFQKILCDIGRSKQEVPNCGTTACAIGWCPYVFPHDFDWNKNNDGVILKKSGMQTNMYNFNAIEEFFQLDEIESNYLFYPSYYPIDRRGPKTVARRIKNVVRNGFPKKMKEYTD